MEIINTTVKHPIQGPPLSARAIAHNRNPHTHILRSPIISHSQHTSSYELSFMLGESASISFESFKKCRVFITACGLGVESDLQLQLSLAVLAIIHGVVSL